MKTLIVNANTRTLDRVTPNLPNMRETMTEWFQPLQFILVKKSVENFEAVETQTVVSFSGIVENISPQELQMRPEGQRKWEYINVWAGPELELSVDDIFRYQNKNYRVMTKNDWSSYGYVQYQCAEDYA